MADMNCEKCKKAKATYHLTAIEDGKKKEGHLCENCARASGMDLKFNFSSADLFNLGGSKGKEKAKDAKESKAEKGAEKAPEKEKSAPTKVKCPDCGITIEDIKRNMRIGCAADYELFKNDLEKIVTKIHGKGQHVGKGPAGSDDLIRREAEIARLKKDLDLVIKSENYEKAAELRDQIKAMEAPTKVEITVQANVKEAENKTIKEA